jgi:hypothetical protein
MRIALAAALAAAALINAEVLVDDNFDDGTADGWVEMPTGATYEVVDGRYHFYQASTDTVYAGSVTGDQYGSMSVSDYSVRTSMQIDAGNMGGVLARFDPFAADGYLVSLLTESGGVMAINRVDDGVPTLLAYTLTTITHGEEYWVRFEVSSDMLGAKIWTGTVSDEPPAWNLTVTDGTYGDAGSAGLFGLDDPDSRAVEMDVWFDDFLVEDDITLDMPADSWGGIKAGAL